MKLKKAEISNYRSIGNLTIGFEIGCQVLVGINESGKSNILRALALLSPDSKTSASDLRIERRDEPPTEEGTVRFVFELTTDEQKLVFKELEGTIDTHSVDSAIVDSGGGKTLSLRSIVAYRKEYLYRVNVKDNARTHSFWSYPSTWQLHGLWRKATSDLDLTKKPGDQTVRILAGTIYDGALYEQDTESVSASVALSDISRLIGDALVKVAQARIPPCVYWRYSDQTILPSQVNSTEFAANPDSCIPLRSMFELAGYAGPKIAEALNSAKSQPAHRYIHLLERVASAATEHIGRVWKDYKSVNIQLRKNGDLIEPIISDDQVPMNFENRSDGFKRFVSFLLLVSAKVKTSSIVNTLILVDEPEIALHPTGARNLSKELVDIGRTNSVIYSTHSIFMIDRDYIDRHLIVEKKNEVTVFSRADKSKVADEEVLYKAIGFSIYEALKRNNVVFEGWRDKQLFHAAARRLVEQDGALRPLAEQLGKCHAEGVKDARNVARTLELANRGCLIVSDSDEEAKRAKKLHAERKEYGVWSDYSDVLGASAFITGEDFLTVEAVLARSNGFRTNQPGLRELVAADLPAGQPRLPRLVAWLKELGKNDDEHKVLVGELKGALFEDLQPEEVVPEYDAVARYILKFDYDSTLAH